MPRPLGDTSPPFTTIEVDRELVRAFRPEAARRATTVPRLITDLLAVIASDHLVTAVLDDERPGDSNRR
jgi:hypothetical protein